MSNTVIALNMIAILLRFPFNHMPSNEICTSTISPTRMALGLISQCLHNYCQLYLVTSVVHDSLGSPCFLTGFIIFNFVVFSMDKLLSHCLGEYVVGSIAVLKDICHLEAHVGKGLSIDCQHQYMDVLGKLMEPTLPYFHLVLPVIGICLQLCASTEQHHWTWGMKDQSASWTALNMVACWAACYSMSMPFATTECQYIHFEWSSYRWQFSVAHNSLDAENNLFNFRVFWFLDS